MRISEKLSRKVYWEKTMNSYRFCGVVKNIGNKMKTRLGRDVLVLTVEIDNKNTKTWVELVIYGPMALQTDMRIANGDIIFVEAAVASAKDPVKGWINKFIAQRIEREVFWMPKIQVQKEFDFKECF